MSVNQHVASLTGLLRKKQVIVAPGRLECLVAQMLRLDKNSSGYEIATNVLNKMERKKQIVIKRHGSVMKEVALFEQGINPKEDSQVTVRIDEEVTQAQAAVEVQVEATGVARSLIVRLNVAHRALKAAVGPDDAIRGPIIPIIMEKVGVSEREAKKLSSLLDKLGLRQLMGQRRNPVYIIDTDVEVVTQEMLDSLNAPVVSESVAVIPANDATDRDEDVTSAAVAIVSNEELKPVGVVATLTEVVQSVDEVVLISILDDGRPPIELLADRLEAANEQNARLNECNGRLAGERDQFEAQLRTANATIRSLTEKVAKLETLSPRVIGLLQLEPSF